MSTTNSSNSLTKRVITFSCATCGEAVTGTVGLYQAAKNGPFAGSQWMELLEQPIHTCPPNPYDDVRSLEALVCMSPREMRECYEMVAQDPSSYNENNYSDFSDKLLARVILSAAETWSENH